MSIVIVTGTGTDIGKTVAAAALAAAAARSGHEVVVVKPAQTGFPGSHGGDADTVTELTGITNTHGFARYPEPMAPVAAARRAGMPLLDLRDTARRIAQLDQPGRIVLVEGAGGLLVRLGDNWSLPDLAALLPQSETVVVTSMTLGSLNTAELTVEVARNRGMNVIGLIAGSVPQPGQTDAVDDAIVDTNLRDMTELAQAPFLAIIPENSGRKKQTDFLAAAPGWMTDEGTGWLAQLS